MATCEHEWTLEHESRDGSALTVFECRRCLVNVSPNALVREQQAELADLRAQLATVLAWSDVPPQPEDEAIAAAFPTRSGSHEAYATAMRLVGARHSKGALVALVNWLLIERDAAVAREKRGGE